MQRISPKVFCTENPQNVSQNVNITLRSEATGSQIIKEASDEKIGEVIYPTPVQNINPYAQVELQPQIRSVQHEVSQEHRSVPKNEISAEFLQLVINAYMINPLKINAYVICTVPDLEKLIEVLTGCDRCDVDINDPEVSCCGKEVKLPYTLVSKIWVSHGESKELFKYKHSDLLQVFEKYRISLKMVDV